MKNNKISVGGFSLVELMVSISIMGILASILYVNFANARAVARDDIRKSDLKNLQLSIELYKAQNGSYPAQGCVSATWAGPGPQSSWGCTATNYVTGLTPDYISSLPTDPISEAVSAKGFLYRTNGTDYKLMVHDSVERKTVTSYEDEFARCPSQTGQCTGATPPSTTYAVYSAGAAGW